MLTAIYMGFGKNNSDVLLKKELCGMRFVPRSSFLLLAKFKSLKHFI